MGKFRYRGSFKKCIFEGCTNTSRISPEKVFLTVPTSLEKRKLWFQAAGKVEVPRSRSYYCCEDHFDLEKDADNWIYFKLMGDRVMLKEGVIPRKKPRMDLPPQLSSEDHKRKLETLVHFASNSEEEVCLTEGAPFMKTFSCMNEPNAVRKEESKETIVKIEKDFENIVSACNVKVEIGNDVVVEYNKIEDECDSLSDVTETLPTLDKTFSKINKNILEMKKIIAKTQEKACLNGIQSRFFTPGQGLELIRKGLELIQNWAQELDAVDT